MLKIVLLTFLTFIMILLSSACFSKHPVDTGNYIYTKKFDDPLYKKQFDELETCIYELPSHVFDRIEHYKSKWSIEAAYDVKALLNHENGVRFDKRKFIQCLEIIAEHNANRFVCTTFDIVAGEEDALVKYALLEYDECIRQKNVPYIYTLEFERPQVGVGYLKQNDIPNEGI